MESVCKLADWLEEDLPARWNEMLDSILYRLPDLKQQQEENDGDC